MRLLSYAFLYLDQFIMVHNGNFQPNYVEES